MSDGGEVSIRFSSKEQEKLWNDIARTVSALGGLQQAGEGMAATTSRSSAALRKFAESVKASVQTPMEQLAATKEKLDKTLEAQLISPEQHAAAMVQAEAKYQAAIEATDVALQQRRAAEKQAEQDRERAARKAERDAEREASRLEREAEREAQRLERLDAEWQRYADAVAAANSTPTERLQAKLNKLSEAHRRGKLDAEQYGRAVKAAEDEHQRELDQTAAKMNRASEQAQGSQFSIGAAAVATGSVIAEAWQGALSAVQRFSAGMQEENARAMSAQEQSGRSLGSLAQIARDEEDMAALTGLARSLFASGAAGSMQAATDAVFAARSTDSEADIPQLRALAEPGVIGSLPVMLDAVAALRASVGAEAGSAADLLAKAKVASGPSTASAEGVLIAAARAGSQARVQGVQVEELLSATGILATAKGSADEGGTRLASLLRGLEDDTAIRGMTLADAIESIQARNLAPEELTKQLTAEGADAFRILATNLGQLRDVSREAAEQSTAATLAKMREIALSESAVDVDMRTRQVRARMDLAREAEGRVVALNEAVIDQGVMERRVGAQTGGLVGMGMRAAFPATIGGEPIARELTAYAYGSFMRSVMAVSPGNKFAESAAMSDRTDPALREALTKAIAERDADRERFAAQIRAAADRFDTAAKAIERASTRGDRIAAPRREAARAAGGE